jgi:hypothetical protein
MSERRVGIWFVGAWGGVAATAALGLSALGRGLTDTKSLVTATPLFEGVDLDHPSQFHFQGFLGTKMILQFTWQGCDSLLAAPLVIDLARLTLLAQRRGECGVLTHLACFFKNPLGVREHDFFKQFMLLEEYARRVRTGKTS